MAFSFYFYFKDANCPLSNHYLAPFLLDNARWPTVEQYFEAMKVVDPRLRELILLAQSAATAKALARGAATRADWEKIQDQVMRRALVAKFRQNAECRAFLLDTGETQLVENAPWDYYWGCGATGEGRNRLGELLMELRAQFMQEAATAVARYGDDELPALPSALGPGNRPIVVPAAVPGNEAPGAPHLIAKAEAA